MTDESTTFVDLIAHINTVASCEQVFGPGRALIEFGSQFHPQADSSARLPRGRRNNCYVNASACALTRDDLFYVEGYGIDPLFPIPFEHAWLVDASGTVWDPTWQEASRHIYFGIPFKRDFLANMLTHSGGVCGLLFNWNLRQSWLGKSAQGG